MSHLRLARLMFFYLLATGAVLAQVANANICDDAAYRAAQVTSVPAEVLLTITRLETGRSTSQGKPWPWTVNHSGNGSWFTSEDDARSYVFSQVKSGETNLDIGCFQINYRWHSDAFRSLDDMFDPDKNALYAADFLERLHTEFGDWTDAAGAYHSRTPKFASRYKAKYREFRARVDMLDPQKEPVTRAATSLIGARAKSRSGSLFPIDDSNVKPLIGMGGSN